MSVNTIILSDFHMAAGTNPETRMTAIVEDFIFDELFEDFLQWLLARDKAPWHLIFAGDVFDFQQVNVLPDFEQVERFNIPVYYDDLDAKAVKDAGLPKKDFYTIADFTEANIYDIDHLWTDDARIEGLGSGEQEVLFKMHKIMHGHEVFFESLGQFLQAGNRVTLLRGNHDVEMAWPSVQQMLRNHMQQLVGEHIILDDKTFQVLPHFYFEENRLYVEHGQQGEEETAIRHVYYPFIEPEQKQGKVVELDFSSFLVRYLINRVESINPLSDNMRPRHRYFSWVIAEHPREALQIIARVLPKLKKLWNKYVSPPGLEEAKKENAARLIHNAEQLNMPRKAAEAMTYVQEEPTLAQGKMPVLKELTKIFLYSLTVLFGISFFFSIMYYMEWQVWLMEIDNIFLRSMLAGTLAMLLLILVINLVLILLKFSARITFGSEERRINRGPEPHFRAYAARINQVLHKYDALVPNIVTGHTHYCDRFQLDIHTWYFNTGTWITLINPEEKIFREQQTLSFVEIIGDRGRLLYYDTGMRKARKVIVEEQ